MVLQQCSQSMLLGSRLCSLKNSIGSPLFSTFLSSLYRFSFGCISGPGFTSTFPRINRILITVAGRVVSDDKDLSCTAMGLLVRVICMQGLSGVDPDLCQEGQVLRISLTWFSGLGEAVGRHEVYQHQPHHYRANKSPHLEWVVSHAGQHLFVIWRHFYTSKSWGWSGNGTAPLLDGHTHLWNNIFKYLPLNHKCYNSFYSLYLKYVFLLMMLKCIENKRRK